MGEYLDERRLIGTTVELAPMSCARMSVVVNLPTVPHTDVGRIEEEVAYALYTYLNPFVGGSLEGPGTGWDLGRALNQGELYGIVHAVPGVDYVKILRVYETDMETGKRRRRSRRAPISSSSRTRRSLPARIIKAEHRA